MSLNRVISYLTGYVEILIRGAQPEKFINLATNSGLYLWDIRRLGPDTIQAKLRSHGFLRIRELLKKSGCRIRVYRKRGWPFWQRKAAKRKMFWLGAIISLGFLLYLASFVLIVKVEGFEGAERQRILDSLNKLGLKAGITRGELLERKRYIEQEMMLVTPEAVWLGITLHGVVAQVKVVPRKIAPVATETCDIIAAEDGVVLKVAVIRGMPVVKEGDTVARGDLLISGQQLHIDSQTGELHQKEVAAGGVIEARVWYDIEVVEPKTVWLPTARKHRSIQYQLRFGNRFYKIWTFGKEPSNNYFWERQRKRIYQGRNPLKVVEIIKDIRQTVFWEKVIRSPEQLKKVALKAANNERKYINTNKIERQIITWTDEGPFLRLIMTLETVKNIARVAPR